MKIRNLTLVAILGSTLLFAACGDDEEMMDPMDTCETADLTYTNFAASLINGSCAVVGCHGEGTTSTFPMNDYTTTNAAVGFGRILGAVNHSPGFSPMPKGGAKLSDCNIDKLTAWINDGAPE